MRISPLTSRGAPAPVNLKRLYLSLIAVILTIVTPSLVTLLLIGSSLDDLAGTPCPGSLWVEEMTMRLRQAQVTFHRSINSPGHNLRRGESLPEMAALLEKYRPSGHPSFMSDMEEGIYRLERLSHLAAGALERGSWVDLQIIVKGADRSSEDLFSLLQEERTRLLGARTIQGREIFKKLRFTAILLGLSLIATGFITVAIYFNWRRLERKVLGIE